MATCRIPITSLLKVPDDYGHSPRLIIRFLGGPPNVPGMTWVMKYGSIANNDVLMEMLPCHIEVSSVAAGVKGEWQECSEALSDEVFRVGGFVAFARDPTNSNDTAMDIDTLFLLEYMN